MAIILIDDLRPRFCRPFWRNYSASLERGEWPGHVFLPTYRVNINWKQETRVFNFGGNLFGIGPKKRSFPSLF
jgi:hypothetical protein